ncbi:MAG TPA: ABC transporter ATP-binding protein [Anaerolineales bacterium]|nr:ABC transporter ATP-binding protein [Anaerolineales bacterium]
MLEVKGLSAGYQGNDVVRDVTFHVNTGEAVMIIGSNGAGKTTLFRSMIGLLPLSDGQVLFEGTDISGLPTHQVVRLGIGFVPAERHLFQRMTVEENLSLGAYPQQPDKKTLAMVMELFPRLAERKGQMARTMSGGEQQMLAVGRALMAKPRLLVLDEPSTGLAPLLARGTYKALSELRKLGLTLLVAEQQVPLVMGFSDRGYVLENGRIEIEGTSAELGANPDVRRAYLGVT